VSYDAFVMTVIAYSIVAVFLILFVVITLPEYMIMNNGQGSCLFYDTFLSCCLGPLYDKETGLLSYPDETTWSGVIQKHFQTDFLVSVWVLFIAAAAQMVYAVYLVILYSTTDEYLWIFFMSSFLQQVGTGIFVYASYPGMFFSRTYWCYVSCQKEEHLELDPVLMAVMFPSAPGSATTPGAEASSRSGDGASEELPLLKRKN